MAERRMEDPVELFADLDARVGEGDTAVDRIESSRASVRQALDVPDEIDARHGRLADGREATDA